MERQYSPQFIDSLQKQGYPPEIENLKPKQLASWTRLPIEDISQGLFDTDRDGIRPVLKEALEDLLMPWIGIGSELPSIQVIQIARKTGLSPESIVRTLTKFPLQVGGMDAKLSVTNDDLKGTLDIGECKDLGISAKKILRDSRYQSRAPGGGPVQKSAIDTSKISPKMKLEARKRARINFTPQQESNMDLQPELDFEVAQKSTPLDEVLAGEPREAEIRQVMDLLKAQGSKNWILGQQESLLAQNLVKLSRGEPCDFLIWNCIGFADWEQVNKGKMPACNITTNEKAAITRYFQSEIIRLSQILSTIGDPQFTILLPTNEAFDPNVWNYKQSINEREQVMDDAVVAIRRLYSQVAIPVNARISVKRWDRYLQEKGALKQPEEYSALGYKRLMESPDRDKIQREAVRSGGTYYEQRGIRVRDNVLSDMQMRYYGVYAGEGVVFEEFQNRGEGIVVLNFEEMRCAQNAFRGANGNLAVVTPITPSQMNEYDQWKDKS